MSAAELLALVLVSALAAAAAVVDEGVDKGVDHLNVVSAVRLAAAAVFAFHTKVAGRNREALDTTLVASDDVVAAGSNCVGTAPDVCFCCGCCFCCI